MKNLIYILSFTACSFNVFSQSGLYFNSSYNELMYMNDEYSSKYTNDRYNGDVWNDSVNPNGLGIISKSTEGTNCRLVKSENLSLCNGFASDLNKSNSCFVKVVDYSETNDPTDIEFYGYKGD